LAQSSQPIGPAEIPEGIMQAVMVHRCGGQEQVMPQVKWEEAQHGEACPWWR